MVEKSYIQELSLLLVNSDTLNKYRLR